MDESPNCDTLGAARWLGLSHKTLERMRVEGRGPQFRKHGRKVLYAIEDLQAWSDSQRVGSTAEAKLLPAFGEP